MRAYAILILCFLATASEIIHRGNPTVYGQQPNKAGVVVRFDDGDSISRCVAFDEDEISGLELLQRSGLTTEIDFQGMGALVCNINAAGCGVDDCLCQCKGGDSCIYWSYWQYQDDSWAYSPIGASSIKVQAGSIDGWSWGPGSPNEAIEPPTTSFEDICAVNAVASVSGVNELPEGQSSLTPYLFFGLLIVVLIIGAFAVRRRRSDS